MLQKFRAVEEIGRFAKLTHKAEPLARLSLIFARNGYGKSTLCSILRSASDGNANHIAARRRLGAVDESRVDTLWATGGTIAYGAGKWNGCPGKIHIFDQEYVARNLHLGDSVTRENKRSLLPVVLGDEGVALAQQVVSLDREQREVDESRKANARVIMARCKGLTADAVTAFCQAEVPDDLAARTTAAAQRVELAKQAAVVKQKRNPQSFSLDGLLDAECLLTEGVDGVAEIAAILVRQHVEQHHLGERAHAWLEYGRTHSSSDECPYCGQDTTAVALVSAYQTYFSDAFKELKARVDEVWRRLDELSRNRIEQLLVTNDADFAYWSTLCGFDVVPTISAGERESIAEGLSRLARLVDMKRQNPLGLLDYGADAAAISGALRTLAIYNERVAACAAIIDQARADTTDLDQQKAEATHSKWVAIAEKISEPVKSASIACLGADLRLTAIKVEKTAAQTALTKYTKATMAARQLAVNDILADFGASFRIVDAKTNFVGREPNTEFAIEIGAHKVKAGDKSDTEPSFKTVLSAGDKSTLALAFFLAQVEADPDLATTVVVFDDPFSSQDLDRQFQTTSHIRSMASVACQTIVLSHDPRFLQLIEKNAENGTTRAFQLQCTDGGEGSVERWSSADELKSLYQQQSEIIREYATQQKLLKGQSLNNVHQAIRPFLEDYLRLRFPGRFPDQAQIFEMANTIKGAGSGDPLASSVADLFALNEYTRPNMHGGGTTPISGELRAHCRKVVAIVGSY